MWISALQAAENPVKRISAKELSKGPLKLSADETISKDHGRVIEAAGHVKVKYLMDNGDTLESVSQFARYDRGQGLGEVWGGPDALWVSADPTQPATRLLAQKIIINPMNSELHASGKVSVIQTSSTLTAENVSYSNEEKKITAVGGRPEFTIIQDEHHTRISAQIITAFTDTREIHFSEKVRGVVLLKNDRSPVP